MVLLEKRTRYACFFSGLCWQKSKKDVLIGSFRSDVFSSVLKNVGKNLTQVTDELSLDAISSHVYTSGLPDPDLIIRTSGGQRLNGFLLWQSTYTEFVFCPTYWPELSKRDFLQALKEYSHRERRFRQITLSNSINQQGWLGPEHSDVISVLSTGTWWLCHSICFQLHAQICA